MLQFKKIGFSVLLLVVGFFLGWSYHPRVAVAPVVNEQKQAAEQTPEAQTVSVMLDFGDGTVRSFQNVPVGNAKNVFDIMKTLSETGNGFVFKYKPPGQYGIMIDQIGNKVAGDEGGKYWLFWVNNGEAMQSADNTPLKAGDVIEWKFINMKFDGVTS